MNKVAVGAPTGLTGTIARYALGNVIQQVLGIFALFFQAKLLSPAGYGIWSVLKVLPSYATYTHLGMRDIMRYLVPYHASRNEEHLLLDIRATVFWGSFIGAALLAVGAVVYASLGTGLIPEYRVGLVVVGLGILATWYYEYRIALLKATQHFGLLIRQGYVRAFLIFAVSVVSIVWFGLYGLLVGFVLWQTLIVLYIARQDRPHRRGRFSWALCRELVAAGFPIMVFGLVITLMRTVGRLIVAGYLSAEQVGYFSISIMVVTVLTQFAGTAREVVEPKLMESAGREGLTRRDYEQFFIKPLITTAALMPIALGPIVICTPAAISMLLPQYVPGIDATRVMCAGIFFLTVSYAFRGVVVANGWQLKTIPYLLVALAANIGLCIAGLEAGYGIEGAATGIALSFGVLYVTLLVFVTARLQQKFTIAWLRYYAGTFLLFLLSLGLVFAMERIVPGLPDSAGGAAVRSMLFLAAYGLTLLFLRPAFPLMDDVITLMGRRKRGRQ